MAKARVFAKRRKAVGNIKKITRTMQLIATARFQQSLNRAVGAKPYTEKITKLVSHLSEQGHEVDHPLTRVVTDRKRQAVLVITSNRGLCGGYNASLLRRAQSVVVGNEAAGVATDLHVVGKKGVNYFRFLRRPLHQTYPKLPDAPRFSDVEPIAQGFIDAYAEGQYESIQVVYMKFLSAARQEAEAIRLLPIGSEPAERHAGHPGRTPTAQYEFSPQPAELLAELLPVTVKVRLFQCFNDAVVGENVARMVAMKSATDAATEMIKVLSRRYNRARQTQITMELLDIIGGVEALK